jgi:hypothetical protein
LLRRRGMTPGQAPETTRQHRRMTQTRWGTPRTSGATAAPSRYAPGNELGGGSPEPVLGANEPGDDSPESSRGGTRSVWVRTRWLEAGTRWFQAATRWLCAGSHRCGGGIGRWWRGAGRFRAGNRRCSVVTRRFRSGTARCGGGRLGDGAGGPEWNRRAKGRGANPARLVHQMSKNDRGELQEDEGDITRTIRSCQASRL